jgi:hypothetical protein
MLRGSCLALWILAASTIAAEAYVSDGHEYTLQCNDDGYVLASRYPVTRTVGRGQEMRTASGMERLYLGRSCDAFHKLHGEGQWCRGNGGFVATFPEHRFGFPRQELVCEPERAPHPGCEC